VRLTESDQCVKKVSGLTFTEPGVYRISARLGNDRNLFESNPIVVRDTVSLPVYWGAIHHHTCYSECWGDSLDVTYRFARDVSGYDFFAVTDHRGSVPVSGARQSRLLPWRLGHPVDSLESWNENIAKANDYYVPHEFVTLIGYEYSCQDIGHHNVYVTRVDDNEAIFPEVYRNGAFELREKMQKANALFIPHAHADIMPFTRLDLRTNTAGEPVSPVFEVYSDWGDSFEPYGNWSPQSRFGGLRHPACHSYLWALDKGYKLGVVADTDTHTGLPGRRVTSGIAPLHCHPQGITAVRMEDFTREGLVSAYRNRRTYGTTGERIFLEVHAGEASMGDGLQTDEPFSIRAFTAGTAQVKAVRLYQGLTLIEEKSFRGAREGEVEFTGLIPHDIEKGYVVMVLQEDENRAWSSPIWVRRASVPDLAWTRDEEGRPVLSNHGGGEAIDVVIAHSPTESPFTVERIAGFDPGPKEIAGLLWTAPKDNHTVAVYYRWRGDPIGGTIRLGGVKDYSVDFCREWFLTDAEFSDDGEGNCRFWTGKPFSLINTLGMDFLITLGHDGPTTFNIRFDEEQATWIGHEKRIGKTITLALDGRTTPGALPERAVVSLAPGARWIGPSESGYWAADPENKIIETDENNNLLNF